MRFLIYGAGALGQAIGCMLSSAGHSVDLVVRQRFVDVIADHGIRVAGVLGEFVAQPGQLGALVSVEQAKGEYDYVCITTKTYDTETAAQDVATLGERAKLVVTMQNGCGNIETLRKYFDAERVLGARVITGFEITHPGKVTITVTADAIHVGDSRKGFISPATEALARAIDEAGHPCVAVADLSSSLHAKLLYNCSLNPLGAILGVHYGALADSAETRMVMDEIIYEVFAVLSAMGGETPWNTAEEYRRVFYADLIPATYTHRPSMLQDIENGKPTEVDGLVGYVARQGKLHGIMTPYCDMLACLVKFKEKAVARRKDQ